MNYVLTQNNLQDLVIWRLAHESMMAREIDNVSIMDCKRYTNFEFSDFTKELLKLVRLEVATNVR